MKLCAGDPGSIPGVSIIIISTLSGHLHNVRSIEDVLIVVAHYRLTKNSHESRMCRFEIMCAWFGSEGFDSIGNYSMVGIFYAKMRCEYGILENH